MNVKSLAKTLLLEKDSKELERALELLKNKEYQKIYELYSDSINELIFVESYIEFIDFLDSETLNESLFIFTFLCQKNICLQIGGYEDKLKKKITSYIDGKLNCIDLLNSIYTEKDVFTDFDGIDNFKEYIKEVNAKLNSLDMVIILFFDDIYSACTYHMFLLNKELGTETLINWDDTYIELI